jgi:hypothetical protein
LSLIVRGEAVCYGFSLGGPSQRALCSITASMKEDVMVADHFNPTNQPANQPANQEHFPLQKETLIIRDVDTATLQLELSACADEVKAMIESLDQAKVVTQDTLQFEISC